MVSPAHMMMALASQEGLQSCVLGQEEGARHTSLWCSTMDCDGGGDELCHEDSLSSPGGKVVHPVIQVCVKAQEVHLFGQFYYGDGVRSGTIIYK